MSTISHKVNQLIHNMTKSRPVLTADLFDQALSSASLTDEEEELIEFVRYTGVIDELILRKGLSLPAKPPALCRLSSICDKIGTTIPDHFGAVMQWSAEQNEDNIAWKGNLICNIAYNSDGIELSPNAGTTLYYTYVVHQELFIGLGF